MLAHCACRVYSGYRIRWIAPMLFSELLVFLIHVVFCFVLPRDENRGGLLYLRNPLCCPYTGNRIRPLRLAPVIGFMGANPYTQKSMVGLPVYNGQYRVRSVVYPSVVPCPSPWFSDTTGGGIPCVVRLSVYGGYCWENFKQSDPWCRCSSDSTASRGFSYGLVVDVQ